jgi:hypothetical protein
MACQHPIMVPRRCGHTSTAPPRAGPPNPKPETRRPKEGRNPKPEVRQALVIELSDWSNALAMAPSPPREERAGERRPFTRSSLNSTVVGQRPGNIGHTRPSPERAAESARPERKSWVTDWAMGDEARSYHAPSGQRSISWRYSQGVALGCIIAALWAAQPKWLGSV